jgi:ribosomal protein L11 methyltransferase
VLDYGCGSGILAIGAARFGAGEIDAVDIDPAAVESTNANAQANGVSLNAGLPDKAAGVYDLVLANILAMPLKVLAPLLCSHVAQGGSLVLAGILERQADELKEAYAPHLQLQVSDTEDGWVLMTARR